MFSDNELAVVVALIPHLPDRDRYVHSGSPLMREIWTERVSIELEWRYAARSGARLDVEDSCPHDGDRRELDGVLYCATCAAKEGVSCTSTS